MQNEENCKGSVVFTHVHRHSILEDLNLLERFHSYPLENVMILYFTRAIYTLQNASRHAISSDQHIFA